MRDGTRKLWLAPLAVSAALSACAHPDFPAAARPMEEPRVSSGWSGGTCEYSARSLTYSDSSTGARSSRTLDVPDCSPSSILCGEDFTVLLSERRAVVALGARSVLGGAEMLGIIGGRFTPANSYSINIREPASEGIRSAQVEGGELRLQTRSGNSWRISLSDPREWAIY